MEVNVNKSELVARRLNRVKIKWSYQIKWNSLFDLILFFWFSSISEWYLSFLITVAKWQQDEVSMASFFEANPITKEVVRYCEHATASATTTNGTWRQAWCISWCEIFNKVLHIIVRHINSYLVTIFVGYKYITNLIGNLKIKRVLNRRRPARC